MSIMASEATRFNMQQCTIGHSFSSSHIHTQWHIVVSQRSRSLAEAIRTTRTKTPLMHSGIVQTCSNLVADRRAGSAPRVTRISIQQGVPRLLSAPSYLQEHDELPSRDRIRSRIWRRTAASYSHRDPWELRRRCAACRQTATAPFVAMEVCCARTRREA